MRRALAWWKARLREPSTWAAVSVGLTFYYLWSILPDTLHNHAIMTVAVSCAIVAFVLEEARE